MTLGALCIWTRRSMHMILKNSRSLEKKIRGVCSGTWKYSRTSYGKVVEQMVQSSEDCFLYI